MGSSRQGDFAAKPAYPAYCDGLNQRYRSVSRYDQRDVDRYGRTVDVCRASGDDLGTALVRLGMPLAFVRYSRHYVDQERQATNERLGVHAHACQPAWEWRAQERQH
jgi:endonuclease YncB( thermonuclease family)